MNVFPQQKHSKLVGWFWTIFLKKKKNNKATPAIKNILWDNAQSSSIMLGTFHFLVCFTKDLAVFEKNAIYLMLQFILHVTICFKSPAIKHAADTFFIMKEKPKTFLEMQIQTAANSYSNFFIPPIQKSCKF